MKMDRNDTWAQYQTNDYDYSSDYMMYQPEYEYSTFTNGSCTCPKASDYPSIDMRELLPPLLVYSVTFITGLLGNILILLAVTGQKQVRQSPTNVFLASLASADLLLIFVCLPLKVGKLLTFTWEFGWFFCKLTHYAETLSAICSVLNLTALSIERYYAVVHPMRAQYLCTTSQAKKVTIFVWLLSCVLAIPSAFARVHFPVGCEKCNLFYCLQEYETPWIYKSHVLYLLSTILLIPGTVMVISYSGIICQLSKLNMERRILTCYPHNNANPPDDGSSSNNRNEDSVTFSAVETTKCVDEANVVEGCNDKKISWSIYFKKGSCRSQSFKENPSASRSNKQRRLSDFIGLQNISVSEQTFIDETFKKNLISKEETIATQPLNGSREDQSEQRDSNRTNINVSQRERETKQVIYMLILIMLLFFTCWAPLLIFNVLAAYGHLGPGNTSGTDFHTKDYKTVFSLLAYFNSCLNPIIYGFMSKHFRRSFTMSVCLRQPALRGGPLALAGGAAEN